MLYFMRYFLALVFLFLGLTFVACRDDNSEIPINPQSYLEGFFPNEIKPASSLGCMDGAYYRKVVSSKDRWIGITGKVVLPTITFDPERTKPDNPLQYLDNPSVYMGGHSNGQETDIGMTWNPIRDEYGNVTADFRAFRPFLRRSAYGAQPANFTNAPTQPEYYWYQGDTIIMSLKLIETGKLRFVVEGMGKKYETTYDCNGYWFGSNIEFKRVNAIDLVGNAGLPAAPTKTKVEGAVWLYTHLFRLHEGEQYAVPLHNGRFTDMRCPLEKYFEVSSSDELSKQGGEFIIINAGKE